MSGKKRVIAWDSSMLFSSHRKKHEQNVHKINVEILTIEHQNSKVIHKMKKVTTVVHV